MKMRAAIVGALLCAATAARAQEPAPTPDTPVLREEDVFRNWLRKSPEVKAWRTQVGAARFDVLTAKLWPNPELELVGNFLLSGTPPDGKYNIQGQVNAPLPIFGQRRARIAAAEQLLSVAELNVEAQLWDQATQIRTAMVERAFAAAHSEVLALNSLELERVQRIIERRAQVGANSQYDVLRVQTAWGTLSAAQTNAMIETRRAEARLLALIADPALGSLEILREGLASFRGPDDEQTLVKLAHERRPDLLLVQRGVKALAAQADSFRADAVPTPSAILGAYQTYQLRGFQITAGVSLPLPITNRNQGAIGRARSEKRGQEYMVEALQGRIRQEVVGAFEARRNARSALEEFRSKSLSAATELLRRAEVSYQAGSFSIAELFDAYETMWAAREQELALEHQSADAEAELERAAALLPLND